VKNLLSSEGRKSFVMFALIVSAIFTWNYLRAWLIMFDAIIADLMSGLIVSFVVLIIMRMWNRKSGDAGDLP